jgi:hypothetical protein
MFTVNLSWEDINTIYNALTTKYEDVIEFDPENDFEIDALELAIVKIENAKNEDGLRFMNKNLKEFIWQT